MGKTTRTVEQALDELRALYEGNQGKPPGHNLTHAILCKLLDVTNVTIGTWLNRKVTRLYTRQFEKLCSVLDKAKDKKWLADKIAKGA